MCACANGSVFVASWSGTFFFFFFSEIIGPAAAGPAGPAPAPLVHVSVVLGFHKPCCLVICSLQSPWLGVIFYPAYADRTD